MFIHHKLFGFLFALFACLYIPFAHASFDNQLIERVNVALMCLPDNEAQETIAIKARMKSVEGALFSQMDFDNDLKRLANEFDRIDPIVESVNGHVQITLKVWPKPLIRMVSWVGNANLATKKLQGELTVGPGCIFDRREFNQAFNKVRAYYVSKGYFEAQLNYTVTFDACTNEVDIEVNICEGRQGRIKDIVFVNFTREEGQEILEMMATKEYNFFLSWINDEGTYREDMVRQDELVILNYIQNKGYADAVVTIEPRETNKCNRIDLVVHLDRGVLYKIGCISVKGNTLFSDEEIRGRLIIGEGAPYSPETIQEAAARVTNLYGRFGYIDAFIDYDLTPADDYTYNITFTIREGSCYRIGLIRVFGNCWTQTNVILHETLLIPGEVFNMEKLRRTEERLLNIGFFKSVNVYPVKSGGAGILDDNFRDVNIEVEETSSGHFGLSFGFSTSESLFGGFNITENNFNAAGFRCLKTHGLRALRGGGEFAHFSATFGTKSTNYLLSWSKPYFMDTQWTVGFDVERSSNRYISRDYDINSTSFTLKGMYPVNQFVRVGCHYRIKNTHIDISGHKVPRQLREEARNSGLLSAIGGSWTYDSTNHPIQPTRGFKSRVEGEFAGLGGHRTFASVSYRNSYYFRILPYDVYGVWRIRADMSFIQPLWGTEPDDIPIDERLFLGGDTTVRGYRPYHLGPKYKYKKKESRHSSSSSDSSRSSSSHDHKKSDQHDPRGGISMQFLSIEYSRPLVKRLEGFVFADVGALSMRRWNFGRFDFAVGFGFKVGIFPGSPPLVIGMGYPLNYRHKSDVKRFFLTLGGKF